MNDVLKDLLNQYVEVRSQADRDFRDDGTLQAYDDRWIVLKKASGEFIYFPIANVRLIKPLQ